MSPMAVGSADDFDPGALEVVIDRLRKVVETLSEAPAPAEFEALRSALEALLEQHGNGGYWLLHAAVVGRLPVEAEVEILSRAARLGGSSIALDMAIRGFVRETQIDTAPDLEIVTDQVTVDVQNTASVHFTSGIQRVVRECVSRWCHREGARLLSWTDGFRGFRPLTDDEWANVTLGEPRARGEAPVLIVPWRTVHLVPELAVDPARGLKIAAMARYAAVEVGIIGYDAIPLTTPSSVTDGMVGNFTRFLAGTSHVSRIAAISHAAAEEMAGWRDMLAGRGIQGPQVAPVVLPVTARETSAAEREEVRRLMQVADEPLFLVVGSHEPRKNHLAVLHAAELLWREGFRFSLAFVGAGSWKAESFYAQVAELQAGGRAIESIRGLPDELLWAAYREAYAVVFPSLNEGYGLPVAEALASGTPVITSNFGSTAEIVTQSGEARGGLLVDPRDDQEIARALRALLLDPALHARLSAEAAHFNQGTWADYAERVWDFLVPSRQWLPQAKGQEILRSEVDRPSESRLPLVFLHIPKCGGVSLRTWITKVAGSDQVYAKRYFFPPSMTDEEKREFDGFSVFLGHFDVLDLAHLPSPATTFSVLREPIGRLVSIYDFWRAYDLEYARENRLLGPIIAHRMTFDEFVLNECDEIRHDIDNNMTRWFSGLARSDEYIENGDAALSKAIEVAAGLDHLGHLARPEPTLRWLADALGVQENAISSFGRSNARGEWSAPFMRQVERTVPSPFALEAMEPIVSLDRRLIGHFFPEDE